MFMSSVINELLVMTNISLRSKCFLHCLKRTAFIHLVFLTLPGPLVIPMFKQVSLSGIRTLLSAVQRRSLSICSNANIPGTTGASANASTNVNTIMRTRMGSHPKPAYLSNSSKMPSLTMFIRKDHYIFSGTEGKSRMCHLLESYECSRTKNGETRQTIPFYLPHSIGLHDFNMSYGQSFITGYLHAHSCFALLFDDAAGICKHSGASVTTVSNSLRSKMQDDPASYYRCFIDTHILNAAGATGNWSQQTELSSYVKGHDGTVIPARTVIDDVFISAGHRYGCGDLFTVPFTFDVALATDSELGIDEDWDRIQNWAKRKA